MPLLLAGRALFCDRWYRLRLSQAIKQKASHHLFASVCALLLSSSRRLLRASILLFLSLVQVHQSQMNLSVWKMNKQKVAGLECLAEIGGFLAQALTRLATRKSSQKGSILGESSLHILHNQSAWCSPDEYGEKA